MKSLKTYAPAIAVAVILAAFAIAKLWPRATPPNVPPAAAAKPSAVTAPAPTASQATPQAASAAAAALPEVPVAKTWPTYHGGTDLCGYSDLVLPEKPAKRWQYIADGPVRQPVVSDEHAVYAATSNGTVLSLDFEGKERWVKHVSRPGKNGAPEVPERFNAPIAVFRGRVFAGSQAGLLHALDAATGEPVWTFDIGGEILGGTTFFAPADTSVPPLLFIIERGDGVFHCLNFETGADLWHTDAIARCDGSPSSANGIAVYGSCASALHAYDAAAGKILKNIPLCDDCQVASGVAIAGDEGYAGNRSGHVVRANLRTGQILWTNQDATKEVFTTPALSKDLLLFGSEDDRLYALDRATGTKKWVLDAKKTPSSPIIASDKAAYTVAGSLHLVKLDSGEDIWSTEISDSVTSPSIIAGTLVVGSEDGTIVAFGDAVKVGAVP